MHISALATPDLRVGDEPQPTLKLTLAERRLLVVLWEWTQEGLGLPTIDDAMPSKFFANRGVCSIAYKKLETRGIVIRLNHRWSTGTLTAQGMLIAAANYASRDTIPPIRHRAGVKLWAPEWGMRTVHIGAVREVGADNPFMAGHGIAKLGPQVTKGRLRGAHIHYLTLEERATCPATCKMLDTCYGDSMGRSVRWRHGPALEGAIAAQLRNWHHGNQRAAGGQMRLIRLHELGDFYSPTYVGLWQTWLSRYDWLHVFGFTAWGPTTPIGAKIALTKAVFGRRFAIRWSGSAGIDGAAVHSADGKPADTAFACPEQTDRAVNCGACGACWSTPKAVSFREH